MPYILILSFYLSYLKKNIANRGAERIVEL